MNEKLYIIIDNKKVELTKEVIKNLDNSDFNLVMKFLKSEINKIFNPYSKEELKVKSEKWIAYKNEKLNYFRTIFNYIYNDMFNRSFLFNDDDIVNINLEFNNMFKEKINILNKIQVRVLEVI